MKKALAILIVTLALALFTKMTLADGPTFKSGKWEFKTTVTAPMMQEPKVSTEIKCITEEEANRDPLAFMLEESECTVLNKKVSGNTIEFELECKGKKGEMGMNSKGKGQFTSDGTTASGNMEMTVDMTQMGGKSMTMTQKWEGKRIGDCD